MAFIFLVEFAYLSWRSLRQSPEKFSFLSLHIKWICVKQLTNIVSEVLEEYSNSLINALFKSSRSKFDHFQYSWFFLSLNWCRVFWVNYLFQSFWIEGKYFSENISTPLDAMGNIFREHFQSAMRDLSLLFRIRLTSIVFSFERYNNLDMSLGS